MKPILTCFLAALLFACSSSTSDTVTDETSPESSEEKLVSDRIIKEAPKAESTSVPISERDRLGLELNEERLLLAYDSNFRYELKIKNTGRDSLSYRFTSIKKTGETSSFAGKVKRIKRKYSNVYKRYNTYAPALLYKLNTDTSITELYIDRLSAEHVRFDHFVKNLNGNQWGEFDPNIIGVKQLGMHIANPTNDYENYFRKTIDKVSDSYSRFRSLDSSSYNFQTTAGFYQSSLNEISTLLKEYDTATTEYVLQEDTSFLYNVSTSKLEHVKKIFQDYGIKFIKRELPSKDQLIPFGFQDALVVDLLNNKGEGLNVEKFYRMKFKDNLNWDNLKFENGLYKLYANWSDFFPHDSLYVAVFSSFGFETVSHLVTLWEPDGGSLRLKEILDQRLTVGIGSVKIEKVIAVTDEHTVFIGRKGGGDAGYVWGSFWIGVRSKPNELSIVFERTFEGSSEWHGYANYRLLNDTTLELETVMQKWENGKQNDSIENVELIDLIGLAKGTFSPKEDIRCSRQILEETSRNIYDLTPEKIDTFLLTISKKCNYNQELSSYRNGVLMVVFDKYPIEVTKLLTEANNYEFEEILKDLTEPTDPRVHIPGIIDKIKESGIQDEKMERIFIALEKGYKYLKEHNP